MDQQVYLDPGRWPQGVLNVRDHELYSLSLRRVCHCRAKIYACVCFGGSIIDLELILEQVCIGHGPGEPQPSFRLCPGRLAPRSLGPPLCLSMTAGCTLLSPVGGVLPSSLSLARTSRWPPPPLTSPSWVCCSEIPRRLLSLPSIWRVPCRFYFVFECFTSFFFSPPIIRHLLTGKDCFIRDTKSQGKCHSLPPQLVNEMILPKY